MWEQICKHPYWLAFSFDASPVAEVVDGEFDLVVTTPMVVSQQPSFDAKSVAKLVNSCLANLLPDSSNARRRWRACEVSQTLTELPR